MTVLRGLMYMLAQLFGAGFGILLLVRSLDVANPGKGMSWLVSYCSLRLPVEAAAAPVPRSRHK